MQISRTIPSRCRSFGCAAAINPPPVLVVKRCAKVSSLDEQSLFRSVILSNERDLPPAPYKSRIRRWCAGYCTFTDTVVVPTSQRRAVPQRYFASIGATWVRLAPREIDSATLGSYQLSITCRSAVERWLLPGRSVTQYNTAVINNRHAEQHCYLIISAHDRFSREW